MKAIYCRRAALGSFLLRSALLSAWSHCGILTDDNTVIEAAAGHGVIERPLAVFLADKSRWSIKTIELPDDAAAIAFVRAQLGKPYDWLGALGIALGKRDWQEPDSWFCSELIEAAAVAGKRQRFVNDVERVTPQHSWMVL